MKPLHSTALGSALIAVLLGSGSASAQFPGGALESMDANRYEFMSRKRIELDAFMYEWQQAWAAPTRDRVRTFYTVDAFALHPGGRVSIGPDAVDSLAAGGNIAEAMTATTDFEVSDYIAFLYGPYALQEPTGMSHGSGVAASILVSDGTSWHVRSQLFMEDQPVERESPPPARPYELSGGQAEEFQRRYDEAQVMMAKLRTAWNTGDATAAAALFSPRALLKLPTATREVRGPGGVSQLANMMNELGTFNMVVLDFDSRARITYMLGRYHLQNGEDGRTGNYIAVLAREGRDLRIRALLLE